MTDARRPAQGSPAAPAIDTVVLDFGNVLVGWTPYGAFPDRTRQEVEDWMAAIDFPAFNLAQDAGRTFAQARTALADRPHLIAMLDEYVEGFPRALTGPVDGSAELVAELRAQGLRLYGLTNWSAELFHHAATAAPTTARLDGVVVSGRVGMAKPDPQIFAHLVRTHDVVPARAVFVDDAPANVEAARDAGFHAVLFTDTAALRTDLSRLGLPVAS